MEQKQPHNLDAEQAILGAILYDNEVWPDYCAELLEPHHFYDPMHGRLYEVMVKLMLTGRSASPVTVFQALADDEAFIEAGGQNYLIRLSRSVPSTAASQDYALLVADLYQSRQIIEIGLDVMEAAAAHDVDAEPAKVIESAIGRLSDLADRRDPVIEFHKQGEIFLEETQEVLSGTARAGVRLGLPGWDARTNGAVPGELIIIAGRPSMGKSIVCAHAALQVAEAGQSVIFYSSEMNNRQVWQRLTAAHIWRHAHKSVPYSRQRQGAINRSEFELIIDAARAIQKLPIHLIDTSSMTPEQLQLAARRRLRKFEAAGVAPGVVLVDYLQRMAVHRNLGSHVAEMGAKAKALKHMARDLDVPVVAMAQLSRETERREDKRPQLSDLRESGEIEQEADAVTFLFREQYYLSRLEPREGTAEHLEWQNRMEEADGLLELISAKGRAFEIGTDVCRIDLAHSVIAARQSA